MDRSLDEIVAESQREKRGSRPPRRNGGGGGGGRRDGRGSGRLGREHDSYPRDGVRKSTRDDSRNMDLEWVHDRYDDDHAYGRPRERRRRPSPDQYSDSRGTKVRVENLHYELTRDDLEGLFSKIGPIVKLELIYDRAGRSEGLAYVTYDHREDANEAIRQFDGANAKGQPIRMSVMSSAPRRNPFDSAYMPGKSLSERITRPRSMSPGRYSDNDRGVDRYVPPGGRRSSRSPPRRRQGGGGGGRRPGARREQESREPRGGRGNNGSGNGGRPKKKTQEELDAEMADYFNPGSAEVAPASGEASAAPAEQPQAGNEMDDMIE